MKNFFIYYNNGYFEATDKMNFTLLHMVDIGVVKLIINHEEGKAWIKGDEGSAKEVKIPEITGL